MLAHKINPILNVSNIVESFAWFEKLGWKKGWEWGEPPTFVDAQNRERQNIERGIATDVIGALRACCTGAQVGRAQCRKR